MANGTAKGDMAAAANKKKAATKVGLKKVAISHLRRLPLEFLNIFVNYDIMYRLIGLLNKRIGLITSVFVVYPANIKYSLAYLYPRRIPMLKWEPWPCGYVWQNKKLTLMFCITASNGDFKNPENDENLKYVADRMEKLRQMVGAKTKTFAGIIPGILHKKGFIKEACEADLTARAVKMAINSVILKDDLPINSPVIVLGGRGFIGRRVMDLLEPGRGHSIDLVDDQDQRAWPDLSSDQPAVVVNITLGDALKNYLGVMRPGDVLINEVYPEPSADLLEIMQRNQVRCYHIVGIQATAIPKLPGAYTGGVPCCGAWNSPDMKVIVDLLN